jgi:hypothetical protein
MRPLVRGFAVNATATGLHTLLFLSRPFTPAIGERLRFDSGITFSFEYVGAFQFSAGSPRIGDQIRRNHGPSGRMALFVKGGNVCGDPAYYALTCGHVLPGSPDPDFAEDIRIDGLNPMTARFAVKREFDFNAAGSNIIDGALVKVDTPYQAPVNTLPPGGPLKAGFANPAVGDLVDHAIAGGQQGKIESLAMSLLVNVGSSEVMLNNMMLVRSTTGKPMVKPGHSGSLITKGDHPLGIVLARATSKVPPAGDLAVVCLVKQTLLELAKEPEAIAHFPGPYTVL